jgi:hypothetical protein
MESLIKIKLKIKIKREWYLQWWDASHGLNKTFLHKMPIDRVTQNLRILQVLQFISVVQKNLGNIKGANTQGFKFTIFSLVLLGCIPFEHQIPHLEIFLACALVKISFYFLLMILCFIKQLLPRLLHFYQL